VITRVVICAQAFIHHPLDLPTSPLPPLHPQPPRILLSPSVMHAPPSAWPQHHTLLDAPALSFALSDPHTSQPLTLGLSASASRTHARTRLLGLILSTLSDVQTSPSGLSDDISPRRHLLTSHLSPLTSHPHTTSPSRTHGPRFVHANSLDCLKSLGELFDAHPNMNIRLLWLPRNIHGRLQEGETAGSRSHLHCRP
jgi:hypothetical protein